MIQVLVIDDHPMIRAGLSATIELEPDIKIIGSADNGREGVELYRQHQPDLVLDGLEDA
jgi:YesN/AraC family two-component response regulator